MSDPEEEARKRDAAGDAPEENEDTQPTAAENLAGALDFSTVAEEGAAEEGAADEGTAEEGAAEEGTAEEGAAEEGTAEEGAAQAAAPEDPRTTAADNLAAVMAGGAPENEAESSAAWSVYGSSTAMEEGAAGYERALDAAGSAIAGVRSALASILPVTRAPEVNYNFIVSIGVDMLGDFREVSNIRFTHDPLEYAEGGYNRSVRMLPFERPGRYDRATLKWGTVAWNTFFDWIKLVEVGGDFRRDVWILQLGREGNPVRILRLADAWPVEWQASDLNAMDGSWAVESLTVVYQACNVVLCSSAGALAQSLLTMVMDVAANAAPERARLWWLERPSASPLSAFPGLFDGPHQTWRGDGKIPDEVLEFPFNPSKLTLKRNPGWQDAPLLGADWQPVQFTGNRADTLTFTVLLDESEYRPLLFSLPSLPTFLSPLSAVTSALGLFTNENSVLHCIQGLYWLTRVHEFPTADGKGTYLRPSLVAFVWEEFQFYGVIDNLDVDFKLFDSDGRPRRAEVTLALRGRLVDPALDDDYNFEGLVAATAPSTKTRPKRPTGKDVDPSTVVD